MRNLRWDLLGSFLVGIGLMALVGFLFWRSAGQPPAR